MTSVRKSPNMMSTTGRIPVIAAPRPMPAMPASEIGESITRSGPNSSTRPDSTLNGVPASATSSPITNTEGSRRSSSASASFTAWPRVSSRVSGSIAALGIDMLIHLAGVGIGSRERELDARRDLGLEQARLEQRDRITCGAPLRLLLLGAVVAAFDVADMVAVVAIRGTEQEA